MPTLAPRLPWQHPFAGGYPRRGGQPLPTDPDAIDYLNRVAAADGASVEVGIAQAIDAFVRGCKADSAGYAGDPTRSNWDAIQASCVMCGARTLSGALVPLKTPYGPELVDINSLPTPTIVDFGGSTSSWDAATRTMTNATYGSDPGYPRFRFGFACVAGKRYLVQGVLSGETGDISSIRLSIGGGDVVSYDSATGIISGVVTALASTLEFLLNGFKGPSSIRIESLSIREDSFTPTPYNFASGDYSRSGATPGLKGDGTTKYLDTNYAYAQNQDDEHLAIYRTVAGTGNWIGGGRWAGGAGPYSRISFLSPTAYRSSQGTDNTGGFTDTLGFFATGRSNGTQSQLRAAGTTTTAAALSNPVAGVTASYGVYAAIFDDIGVFFRSPQRAAFYSVGSAIDLAAMDERVTNLVTAIKFHSLTGLLPNDYDPATIAYITAAYAAGGTL